MFECLVLGDSIAYGVGHYRPDCLTVAKIGITSEGWYNNWGSSPLIKDQPYKVVVISLSTNDHRLTREYLNYIRMTVKANMVIWLAPSYVLKPVQRKIVEEIALKYRDKVLDISKYTGAYDRIHPTGHGYKQISEITREIGKIR